MFDFVKHPIFLLRGYLSASINIHLPVNDHVNYIYKKARNRL